MLLGSEWSVANISIGEMIGINCLSLWIMQLEKLEMNQSEIERPMPFSRIEYFGHNFHSFYIRFLIIGFLHSHSDTYVTIEATVAAIIG